MADWMNELTYDPLPYLLNTANGPLRYFVGRDLLGERPNRADTILTDARSRRILAMQLADGRWEYPGGGNTRIRSLEDYDQIETYRQLGILVEKFGFTNKSMTIRKAAEFMFAHQTEEGDFRGIYGRQYTPNYSAGIMELLIKAGYEGDSRIQRGFHWLLSIRQNDGGWAIPFRTVAKGSVNWVRAMQMSTVLPDPTKPFSHLVTGVVLRAFAADTERRRSKEALAAGRLLAGRFFKSDLYPDRRNAEYWWRVSFPFWFTDVVCALDSLSLMGLSAKDSGVEDALAKLKKRQLRDGSFDVKLLRTGEGDLGRWVCLAVCRVFKRFYINH